MTKIKNLDDLFQHEILDLLSAEDQAITALPKMRDKASSDELKKAFEDHLQETKEQKKRLETIVSKHNMQGKNACEAMQGLVKEAQELMNEDIDPEVLDAGLIGEAQRIEHYEIAGYGTAITFARMLGHQDAVELLQKTLDEEKEADQKLTSIAESNVNRRARGGRAA